MGSRIERKGPHGRRRGDLKPIIAVSIIAPVPARVKGSDDPARRLYGRLSDRTTRMPKTVPVSRPSVPSNRTVTFAFPATLSAGMG